MSWQRDLQSYYSLCSEYAQDSGQRSSYSQISSNYQLMRCIRSVWVCDQFSRLIYQYIYYQLFIYQNTRYIYSIIIAKHSGVIMKISKFILTVIILIATFSINRIKSEDMSVKLININKDWEVELTHTPPEGQHLKNKKMSTQIPSTIHLDLLKNKLIEDPFYRNNYPTVKWVSNCHVKYSKNFTLSQQDLKRSSELVFHGIDTYSTVKLNGQEILKSNNSFVKYTLRVQKFLKTQNQLEVLIESAEKYDLEGQSKNSMPFKYAHTRKACYQYSWDWAPEMITMGIWKDVQIRFFDDIRIDYVWIRNKQVSQQKAVLNFATQFELNTFKNQKLGAGYQLKVSEKGKQDNAVTSQVTQSTNYINLAIQNPKYWWPNGIGQPHIYQFTISLLKDGKQIDKRQQIYGIRTVTLDLQNKHFKVVVNGYPVYCKGANYVPLDMLYARVSNEYHQNEKTYTIKQLFDDAVLSNFNMIRVWGGGQYESDQFMEQASRKGIMIFYDFMFSDSIYPSNYEFLANVQQQAKQQIRRARNYPALSLWCGNNQILQGIQDWGWGSGNYVKDYKTLFQTLLKKVVQIQSPDISYIPSSPIYGVGNYGFQRGGDFHYWGVWAGGSPFQSYQNAVGPFNSQFGTQALPVWHTIKQFTKEEDRSYNSNILLAHERHGSQFGTLIGYMQRYMKKSKNFQNEVYLSSLVQAFAIQIAIRAQRAAKPKSYGTLYWQFNDAWPAISWAAIDYYGRWKALQYMAKRSYENIAIFILSNNSVVAINDLLTPVDVVTKTKLIDFNGKVFFQEQKSLTLDADSVKQVSTIDQKHYSNKPKQVVAYTEIFYKDKLQMWSTKYFSLFKDMYLPKATLEVKYEEGENKITVQSDKLIKNLFIDHKQKYVQFSDNYFDVIPGHPRTVQVLLGEKLSQIVGGLKFTSVRQASEQEQLEVKHK